MLISTYLKGNALFDKLTVDEHLWLIHGLKNASGNYKDEASSLLSTLELDEKKNEVDLVCHETSSVYSCQ